MSGWVDALETRTELVEEDYNQGSVYRGSVGNSIYFVKEDKTGSRRVDALAYTVMDEMGVPHADGFYDQDTEELVEQEIDATGLLKEYDGGEPGAPRLSSTGLYDALVAKYVLGDPDLTENMAVGPAEDVTPFDCELAGDRIDRGFDDRFLDHVAVITDSHGIDFTPERFYDVVRDRVDRIDLDRVRDRKAQLLTDSTATDVARRMEGIVHNIELIRGGWLDGRAERHRQRWNLA